MKRTADILAVILALLLTILVTTPRVAVADGPPDALTILVTAGSQGDKAALVREAIQMGSTLGFDMNSGWNLSWTRGWYGQMDRLPQAVSKYVAGRQWGTAAQQEFAVTWGAISGYPLLKRLGSWATVSGSRIPMMFMPYGAVPPQYTNCSGFTCRW